MMITITKIDVSKHFQIMSTCSILAKLRQKSFTMYFRIKICL